MPRYVRRLSPSEIAARVQQLEESEDSDVSQNAESENDSEEDALYQYVDDDESDDSDNDSTAPISLRQLTYSQQKLDRADFHLQTQSDVGPYRSRPDQQGIRAEWLTAPPPVRRRRDPANILTHAGGVHGSTARNTTYEADAFKLFITDDIVNEIIFHTNERLQIERQRIEDTCTAKTLNKTAHRLRDITHSELYAFFGLCILRGFYKNLTLPQLFHPETGPAIFRATMGARRFSMIIQTISFDELESREERRQGDKFCPLRKIFNEVDENLRKHFLPSECVTLDESLVRFRGRCSFRMYVPSKPGKYGIIIRTAADANYRYMWKMWPYSGKPNNSDASPPAVYFEDVPTMVKHMVNELKGTGRNITMDRFFTSIPLAEELSTERLTMVGTVNKNRKYLPTELTDPRNRDAETNVFAFRNGVTLVSHCPKPKKLILAVSTQHRNPLVDSNTGKSEIILYYNATKGGVDSMDAIIGNYMCKPAVRRWPTTVFFFLVGVAEVNASTIILMNRGQGANEVRKGVRREIIFSMGQQLTKPRINERIADQSGLNSSALTALSCFGTKFSQPGTSTDASATTAERGRCFICLEAIMGDSNRRSQKNKMTKKLPCTLCKNFVCERHSTIVRKCDRCTGTYI